jgi:hypothetical protein
MITDLIVVDDAGTSFNASEFVTSLSVSLTADSVNELKITLNDPFLDMLNKNVWQLRRKITYLGTRYEVASIEVSQGQGREKLVIQALSEACQKLKRDKGQASFPGLSPTGFAKIKADEFGLRFFGENKAGKKTIVRARNDKVDESSWMVLGRLADENNFLLFETDNTLFFASEKFLLGKFAVVRAGIPPTGFQSVPIYWIADAPPGAFGFKAIQCPQVRTSDDSKNIATLSLQLEQKDGKLLRPGMTINLVDIPLFNKHYIVTDVTWDEGVVSSVSIAARTPEELNKIDISTTSTRTTTLTRTI